MFDRNTGSRWANEARQIDVRRSQIPISFHSLTTGNAGFINPICAPIEVLPGDGWRVQLSGLMRAQTPLFSTMSRAYIDTYWFFVPMRLVWDHTKQFFGESDVAGYDSTNVYQIPTINTVSTNKYLKSDNPVFPSVADGFGIPPRLFIYADAYTTELGTPVNALPFRAYRLIYNDYFRDQNLQNPLPVNTGDDETDSSLFDILRSNKLHDYFTSALPWPQKGPDVLLPVGEWAPVYSRNEFIPNAGGSLGYGYQRVAFDVSGSGTEGAFMANLGIRGNDREGELFASSFDYASEWPADSIRTIRPLNLWADLSTASGLNILQMRQAFAAQRLYEDFSMYGSRYHEMLRSVFGVLVPESFVQIPEYLGGHRYKLNIQQVTQTSSSSDGEQLGSQGAYSLTTFSDLDFDKTFLEHGYIIGLWTVRNENYYQDGLSRLWTRSDMLDFYWPQLANVGSQPVYSYEIYSERDSVLEPKVFGYQERHAEYRYIPSQISGNFRSSSGLSGNDSISVYTYADSYRARPYLSEYWIQSDPSRIGQTLSQGSSEVDSEMFRTNQFFADFFFDATTLRKMPIFGGHSLNGWM